jgi:hypothetical protein
MSETGAALAAAIAAKDVAALRDLLAIDVDFKALTPGRFWEGRSAADVVDVFFAHWFAPSDEIEALVSHRTGDVGERKSVTYRLQVRNPDGQFEVEQQAYFGVLDGRITFLRMLCSGSMSIRG